jgi:hypothetical protein
MALASLVFRGLGLAAAARVARSFSATSNATSSGYKRTALDGGARLCESGWCRDHSGEEAHRLITRSIDQDSPNFSFSVPSEPVDGCPMCVAVTRTMSAVYELPSDLK